MRKMSRKLRLALSLEDEIYYRYKSMMEEITKRERAFQRAKNIVQVLQKTDGGAFKVLQIVDKYTSTDGTKVIVR
jgi:hypothetical protein